MNYTLERFSLVEIEKCDMCGKKECSGYREGVSEEWGICSSHSTKHLCEKCFEENTYTNEYGFTFLWYKNHLFCYKPYQYLDFGFRQVTGEWDIERAFNPDRYNFNKWLNDRQ